MAKSSITRQTIKIYWQHSKKYAAWFFVLVLSVSVATGFELYKPFLYERFFNQLAAPHPEVGILLKLVMQVLAISFCYWSLWRVATFIASYFEARVMTDLLNTCFEYLHRHSYSFFTNNFAGSLVRKVNKYSRSFEMISDQLFWSMIPAAIRVVAICIIVSFQTKLLGLIILIWSIAYISFIYLFSLYKLKYDKKRTEMDTETTAVLADTITNNINIKLFTGYKKENQNFSRISEIWYKTTRLSWDLGNVSEAAQGGFMIVLEFLLFYFALKYWQRGLVGVGYFVFLQAYILQLNNRLWELGRNIRRVYEGFADAEEMTGILNTAHEIKDAPNAQSLKVTEGKIEFTGVGFKYQNHQEVFNDFNLVIKPGERVALIGPSGGGKTTVTRLILRFFDVNRGKILIDGADISEVTQESLRKNIALVPQDPILFHRTLMENIRYAKPTASDEEVVKAAHMAHCHEFIERLPKGYQTYVGERGIKLSGGERQRVAIARAILKNAPILVLDEATSSLDSESEHYIQDALKTLMTGKTTIVIAHRLSTIMQMDRILVLENGRITEEGKHEELLKVEQGTYQRLWEIQAGSFA